MKTFILKFHRLLFLTVLIMSCNAESGIEIDKSLLTGSWICREVFSQEERQEIFSGAYALEINDDNSYVYHAGMHEDSGIWSLNKEGVLLKSKTGEKKELSVITLNDTSLVVEMEQMGVDLRMHFVPEN